MHAKCVGEKEFFDFGLSRAARCAVEEVIRAMQEEPTRETITFEFIAIDGNASILFYSYTITQ